MTRQPWHLESSVSPLAAYLAGLPYPVRPIGEKDVENVTDQGQDANAMHGGLVELAARAALARIRAMVGLPDNAAHQEVVDAVQDLQIDRRQLAEALAVDPHTSRDQMFEVARRQRIEAATAREIYEPADDVITVEEAARRRAARQEALHTVMDLWQQHQLGEDLPAMDDLVMAAEWLATGDTGAVERLRQLYVEQGRPTTLSPDAASWTPGMES